MNDMNPRAVIGGNNPPDPIDDICAQHQGVIDEATIWLDGESTVDSEKTMLAVDRVRKDARQWRLDLERGQKAATAPLYDAYKAEGARWKPTIDDAKRIEAGLVALIGPFKDKMAAQKEAERRAAWEAAEAAKREAEEAARQAVADDLEAQREAAAAADEALIAEKKAQAAQRDTVKGMRTVTRYEITDHRAALHDIAASDRDAMTAFIEDYVRRNYKARAIKGVRVWQEKEAF